MSIILLNYFSRCQGFGDYNPERFSRKVFVGGLPPDIDEGKLNRFLNFKFLPFNHYQYISQMKSQQVSGASVL